MMAANVCACSAGSVRHLQAAVQSHGSTTTTSVRSAFRRSDGCPTGPVCLGEERNSRPDRGCDDAVHHLLEVGLRAHPKKSLEADIATRHLAQGGTNLGAGKITVALSAPANAAEAKATRCETPLREEGCSASAQTTGPGGVRLAGPNVIGFFEPGSPGFLRAAV